MRVENMHGFTIIRKDCETISVYELRLPYVSGTLFRYIQGHVHFTTSTGQNASVSVLLLCAN